MHEQWQEQIPFYVAGTLPPQEAAALERHLDECAVCRKAAQEWQIIADTVRSEAELWSKPLPPLSAAVRDHLKARPAASTNGFKPHGAPPDPEFHVAYLGPQAGSTPSRRRNPLPASLAAALFLLVLFGALLIFVIGPGLSRPQTEQLSSGPGDDNSITRQADETQPVTPMVSATRSNDLGIIPAASATKTPLIVAPVKTVVTPTMVSPGLCSVQSADGSIVNLHAGPGSQYEMINGFANNTVVPVLARSDNGWYRVALVIWTSEWIGWVRPELVNLVGNCDGLPTLRAAGYLPEVTPGFPVTPTARYMDGYGSYDLVVKEAVGPFAADARVRLSHAYFNNQEWVYYVVAEDEVTQGEVLERYIQYAPDITPGAPTPTAGFDSLIGMGMYDLWTTEAVGPFAAYTRVRVSYARFTGKDWVYYVVAQDETTGVEVPQSKLTYAPGATPGAPTPTTTPVYPPVYTPVAPTYTPTGLPCLPTFYFTNADREACSVHAEQSTIQAAYQQFEGGYMLWRGDTGEIIVLMTGGQVLRYEEGAYASRPDNPVTDTPPQGRSRPVSGFGRVWGNFPVVRNALGWAFAPEQGYMMTVQFTPAPAFTPYFYMTLPEGGAVAQIHDDNTWNYESP